MSAAETAVQPAPKKKVRAAKKKVKDAQTGKYFDVIPEGRIDVMFAWISAAYSLAVIGYLVWLVLDLLYGAPPSAIAAGLKPVLSEPASKLIFYTAIGGAIGAAVNNLRSFITWHAEERAFGWRFIWKYLAMPPLGGTLAVLVYGILQTGMAVFTGGNSPTSTSTVTSLSAWATGTLAGYGSHKVFKWLDDKVNSLFKVDSKQVAIPDVKGKSLEEAKQLVANVQLEVGTVSEAPASSDQVGKVIAQTPAAGTQIDCGSKVDLTVGIAAPDPADVTPKPQNEVTTPQNGKPPAAVETVVAATGETVAPNGNAATVAAVTTAVSAATNVGTDVSIDAENASAVASPDDETITDTSSVLADDEETIDDEPTNGG